ncbi:MAG: Asp-tRNA(Asn)/Glu-tRNA(Gln) amidotransferase subunit GatB [bacterium]|nr:Asp-tRNA(Asn)/Glu-tRNA(Gln) amidotransferase subunit GatB [bacterium]
MNYEAVIGLEVHAELLTKSKCFCSCSTEFGNEPNSQICPICSGFPGVLPVLNKEAVAMTIKTGLALHCEIATYSRFARKNYYYPDLPKNYQISQYAEPLSRNGYIEIPTKTGLKTIGITRVHLEEDAGKLLHSPDGYSLVDLNRTGVPLMEIVSEPDIRSPEEAKDYLMMLRAILQYLEVCNGNMEEGTFRCDANVSIRPVGTKGLGTKAEIKNMNSFKNVQKALEYEVERQIEMIESGERIIQETRLWNPDKGITEPMRSKEYAHDYRYFPEPDLVPMEIAKEWIEEIRATMPELPMARKSRFITQYQLPEYDAELLTVSKPVADFYEAAVKLHPNAKSISNWIMTELMRELSGKEFRYTEFPITPMQLANLVKLIDTNMISGKTAKQVFNAMLRTDISPENYVKEKGLIQITDTSAIEKLVDEVIAQNEAAVAEYKKGKEGAINALVGQVMKASKGKANPQVVNQLLKQKLSS